MKLSKALVGVLQDLHEQQLSLSAVIARINVKCSNLPSWYQDKPVEYYEGVLDQVHSSISQLLTATNNYHGYNDRTSTTTNDLEFTYRFYYGDWNKSQNGVS